jgi:hypothetical protein
MSDLGHGCKNVFPPQNCPQPCSRSDPCWPDRSVGVGRRRASVGERRLSKSGLRVEARLSNPNDFAVFDVLANCDFKDRHGRILASSPLMITDAIQANSTNLFGS